MSASSPTTAVCGIIMPISATGDYTAAHWLDVKAIITEAASSISNPQFSTKLVSEADETAFIHRTIVQNVVNADIVVCDSSSLNPNVMFELGLRLAFDKPTVIIKDDETRNPFDTGIIEYLPYPRDLRFPKVVAFKAQLAAKILATYEAPRKNPSYSLFLKHLGIAEVAAVPPPDLPEEPVSAAMLNDIRHEVTQTRHLLMRAIERLGDRSTQPPAIDPNQVREASRSARTFKEIYDRVKELDKGTTFTVGPNGIIKRYQSTDDDPSAA